MARIYRSAQGLPVDIDSLRLSNEETIAVGNMKVNARGDQLGPNGEVVQGRNQVMDQHYALHSPEPTYKQPVRQAAMRTPPATPQPPVMTPNVDASGESFDPPDQDPTPQLRGSLADSIAREVKVEQTKLTPLSQRNANKGPTRI